MVKDRRVALLAYLVVALLATTSMLDTVLAYRADVRRERARLGEIAAARASLLSAVVRFNAVESPDYPGGEAAATLAQLRDAWDSFAGFGDTGEFTVARREGNDIVFVQRLRHNGGQLGLRISPDSDLAEPMTRALAGGTGTMVGRDYRGERVLAAYAPVPSLGVGLVAKIDLAEIRGPALRDGVLLTAVTLLLALAGIFGVARVGESLTSEVSIARDEARTLAQRLDLALEAGGQGVFDHDYRTGRITVSPEFCRLLGYEPGELVETEERWRARLHPDDRAAAERAYRAHLAGDTDEYVVEVRQRTKQGEWKWILALGRIVERDEAGRPVRMVGTYTDLTAQKDAERALEAAQEALEAKVRERTVELVEANRELEAFTYTVSHDLRTPLRAVDGYSAMLASRLGEEDPEAVRLLGVIRQSTARMNRLLEDLLRLSRAGRQELKREPVDLEEVVRDAFQQEVAAVPERSVELRLERLPTVNVDLPLMTQVMQNLVGNAVKFTAPRDLGLLEVGCEQGESGPIFYVRDNGVGFDMAHAHKLFEPFKRLHYEDEFPGTGVGLSIVRRIVERHGGSVWAEAAPGAGATVFFTLPESEGAAA